MKIRPITKLHTLLAVDFDGTIVDHEFPYIGQLKPNAKQVINELYDEGFGIFIWTCRDSTFHPDLRKFPNATPTIFDVHDFLEKEGIKYDGININHPQLGFQPVPKIYGDIYIDDKQLGGIPNDWRIIKELIDEHLNRKDYLKNRTADDAPGKASSNGSKNNKKSVFRGDTTIR